MFKPGQRIWVGWVPDDTCFNGFEAYRCSEAIYEGVSLPAACGQHSDCDGLGLRAFDGVLICATACNVFPIDPDTETRENEREAEHV